MQCTSNLLINCMKMNWKCIGRNGFQLIMFFVCVLFLGSCSIAHFFFSCIRIRPLTLIAIDILNELEFPFVELCSLWSLFVGFLLVSTHIISSNDLCRICCFVHSLNKSLENYLNDSIICEEKRDRGEENGRQTKLSKPQRPSLLTVSAVVITSLHLFSFHRHNNRTRKRENELK